MYCGRRDSEIRALLKLRFPDATINLTKELVEVSDTDSLDTQMVLKIMESLWQTAPESRRGPAPNADTALKLLRAIENEEEKIWKEVSNF